MSGHQATGALAFPTAAKRPVSADCEVILPSDLTSGLIFASSTWTFSQKSVGTRPAASQRNPSTSSSFTQYFSISFLELVLILGTSTTQWIRHQPKPNGRITLARLPCGHQRKLLISQRGLCFTFGCYRIDCDH